MYEDGGKKYTVRASVKYLKYTSNINNGFCGPANVTSSTVNVRSGPGIDYSVVDRLSNNTSVYVEEVVKTSDDEYKYWAEISKVSGDSLSKSQYIYHTLVK